MTFNATLLLVGPMLINVGVRGHQIETEYRLGVYVTLIKNDSHKHQFPNLVDEFEWIDSWKPQFQGKALHRIKLLFQRIKFSIRKFQIAPRIARLFLSVES